MARINPHGGECCGMRHLRGFTRPIHDRNENFSEADRTSIKGSSDPGLLTEIVLTDRQLNERRRDFLEDAGFRLVTKFKNKNSGNIVHVFHDK